MLKKINRASLRKYPQDEINSLVDQAVERIKSLSTPLKIILFGSSVDGDFDDWSDLDFVLVFKTKFEATEARKKLYVKNPLNRPIDYICVDLEHFNKKSKLGGVLYTAATEGKFY